MSAKPAPASETGTSVGIVAIGRNEGARLGDCLRAALTQSRLVVYADSRSDDGSAELARSLGVVTVVLDSSAPLTAARGRNAGFAALRERCRDCDFVQFVDGDCILAPGWIETATAFLRANPRAAVACGRRFEAFPQASLYNRLSDEEWDTPIGRTDFAGGDTLIRIAAFEQVGGFRPDLRAGEEPEMTARMRAAGWEIWRLDAPMTEHDARILRFGQWWRRAQRGGFGYAQVRSVTASLPQPVYVAQLRSAFIWTLAVPLGVGIAAAAVRAPALLLLLPVAYALQVARIAARKGLLSGRSWQSAAMILLAKVPETIGAMRYFLGWRPEGVGEYKGRAA
jgi:GT2 family glycosyltransferase